MALCVYTDVSSVLAGQASSAQLSYVDVLSVIIANRAATSAYDAIVLVLTVIRTARLQRQATRLSMSSGLFSLLLKDGARS